MSAIILLITVKMLLVMYMLPLKSMLEKSAPLRSLNG